MAINERLIDTEVAAAADGGAASVEQNLILHLDANDVDSYDGDGSIWYDISEHDVTIPLSDNADDLELHLNASDSTSYGGSGTTWTDISGNSRNATLTSAVSATYDKDNGGYFEFTAASVGVTVPHDTAFNSSTDITLECWVKRDDTTEDTIINKGDDGTNSWFLMYNPSNGYYYYNYATGGGVKSGTSGLSTGQWEHVVVTRNSSGTPKIYVNGEDKSIAVGTANSTSTTDTGSLSIGGANLYTATGHGAFDGKIGAVRIYSKELSASEIGQNYRHGRDYIYTDLIDDTDLELHLDPTSYSGSGTTWTSDAGNNGTISGATYDQELGDWFSFDGSNDKITIANQSAFHSTNSFTYELWVRKNNTGEDLVLKLGSHPTYYLIYNNSIGYWFLDYTSSTTRQTRTGSVSDTIGKWTHVCVVHDPSVAPKIYVNGVYMSTMNISGSGGTSGSRDLLLGDNHSPAGWSNWDGDIGQVRFYSSALSADEVMQNFNFTKNNYPNSNHGTITGATWNSYYFDFERSSSNNVTISDSSSLDISGDITLSAWINEESVDNYGRLFWKSSAYALYRGTNGWTFLLGSTSLVHNSNIPSTGTWYHIAATYDGSNQKLYINGVLVDTESMTASIPTNNNSLYIGGIDSNRFFDGKIGAVKIYSKALTASELLADYNATKSTYGL